MLIFKEASGALPKKLRDTYDPKKIVLKANSKGWMNSTLLLDWVKEIWAPNVKEGESYLLIWDSFSAHKDETVLETLLEDLYTEVQIIPGGCTPVLQPLDVGINKPLKDKIRREFEAWSTERLTNPSGILIE